MKSMQWIYLIIAIVSEVIATSALKASAGFTRWVPLIVVAAGYGLSFYFLSLTLRSIPLGISYAIWSSVGMILVVLVGWAVYRQALDLPAFIGIGLIVAGVIVLTFFSKTAVH
jgi:small multidrug resistance pump